MSYKALALQLTCQTVNAYQTRDEAEALMLQSIERIERQIAASVGLLGRDTLLVVVPEFFLTGPPVDETVDQWREKAALEIDGRIYEALSAMVQRQQIYFSGNAYEQDPFFPELYFQTSFIIGPNGDMSSALSPVECHVYTYSARCLGIVYRCLRLRFVVSGGERRTLEIWPALLRKISCTPK